MKIKGTKIFSIAASLVFLLSAAGYFYTSPRSVLDTRGRDSCNASLSSGSSGRIYLQITGGSGGNFRMKGIVFVPTWLWPKDVSNSQKGWLYLPWIDQDGEGVGIAIPTPISTAVNEELDSMAGYRIEVEEESVGFGSLRAYPFDRYWVGIQSASLILPTQGGQEQVSVPLELNVRFNGDAGWDARRKIGVDTGTGLLNYATTVNTLGSQSSGAGSCGLVLSRSLWYLGLVGSLLAVMVVPAIYVWPRPQEPAGLELIAAMLGVATIRTYLVGTPSSAGGLLPFDFVLALIVGVVAFAPLWKPDRSEACNDDNTSR